MNNKIWSSQLFGQDTCLWVGGYNDKATSRKISSIPIGMIPEFTQLGPKGEVVALGWRRIFSKVRQVAKIPQAHIENAFGVSLEVQGSDGFCWSCKKVGKLVKATSKGQQCDFHRQVLDRVRQASRLKEDNKQRSARYANLNG